MYHHAATEKRDVKLFDIMPAETEAVFIGKVLIEQRDHITEQLMLIIAKDGFEAKLVHIRLAVIPEKGR